jgi:bifunctional enzyme CysN/CysC
LEILRFTTAGSVDDGKSTLIGRLLFDSKLIFEDQMEEIQKATVKRGEEGINLALLTDGLRAEREQNITIDVAYRYFATPKRKFIIADTPGHEQYTRNMVTGASTSDLAIILIDARKGLLTQSKRHASISSLLQIPHIVVCINKMDLADYSEDRFHEIVEDFERFADKLEVDDITYIPISALKGDNIVNKSEFMPWYKGSTLLYHLENVNVSSDKNLVDFRFPVQYVIRPHQDFRGFAGRITSGTIKKGERVRVLPSGLKSTVESIVTIDGELEEARAGDSVVISITDNIDISRGDMIVREKNLPTVNNLQDAFLCWMNAAPLEKGKRYLLRHTTKTVNVYVKEIVYRLNVNELHRENTQTLELNDIGRVELETAQPLFFDPYKNNRGTGSFILIDPATNVTLGAGMIKSAVADIEEKLEIPQKKSPNTVWEGWNIPRPDREARNGHKAAVIWFTGLSGAGKTTIGRQLEKRLFEMGLQTTLLDGDQMRHGLCRDLGFTEYDRRENIRRISETARLMFENGNLVICTFISPFRSDREFARSLVQPGRFVEVFINCKLETLKERDPKGLYEKAIRGEIKNFTGISSPYEAPENPELIIDSTVSTPDSLVEIVMKKLVEEEIVKGKG